MDATHWISASATTTKVEKLKETAMKGLRDKVGPDTVCIFEFLGLWAVSPQAINRMKLQGVSKDQQEVRHGPTHHGFQMQCASPGDP